MPSLFDACQASSEVPVHVGKIPHGEARSVSPFELTPDQNAALNLEDNRVISASAGTGKTHTLTALYLALLCGRLTPGGKFLDESEWFRRWNQPDGRDAPLLPRHIVAVTFTEKAAAELLKRARGALTHLKDSVPAGALKAHLEVCAQEIFSAPVSTIHSFCGKLLREAGAHSPAPSGFETLVQEPADELLQQAFAQAAAEMLDGTEFPHLRKLALEWQVFTDRSGLVALGMSLLRKMRSFGQRNIETETTGSIADVHALLHEFYEAVRAGPSGRGGVQPRLSEFCDTHAFPESLDDALDFAIELKSTVGGKWIADQPIRDTPARILLAADRPHAQELALFVRRGADLYEAAKRRLGALDFDDLLLHSQTLLSGQRARALPGLENIRFLLVDEYQDTNPIQHEVLTRAAFPTEEKCVRMAVVGDVKQSIYRFRGADVSLLENLSRTFSTVPLRENFRSRGTLISFFNRFFESLRSEAFVYDENHRIAPGLQTDGRHGWKGPVGEIFAWPEQTIESVADHRQQQAVAIARRIRSLISPSSESAGGAPDLPRPQIWDAKAKRLRSEVRYRDIAILSRSLKHLRMPLQMAFSQLRIPFRLLKGASFYSRPEIVDVLNLWTVAADFSDDYATAGFLRSPFAGLSDSGVGWVLQRSARKDSVPLARRVINLAKLGVTEGLADSDVQALRRAAKILETLELWRGRRTAVEILDWAAAESGFLNTLALLPRGEYAVAAVRALIEIARSHESRGNSLLSDFVRWLGARADAEWDQDECETPDLSAGLPAEDDAVQIGTVHSAKGLEFPIVLLADLGYSPNVPLPAAVLSSDHGLGLRIGSLALGLRPLCDAAHNAESERESAENREESLRLLYVALTRASDYLIFCGETKSEGNTDAVRARPWRDLIGDYITNHPGELAVIPADHPGLLRVKPDLEPALLRFSGLDDPAPIRHHGVLPVDETRLRALLEVPAGSHPAPPEIPHGNTRRVSVSKLASWLWCPRKAALDAVAAAAPAGAPLSTDAAEDAPREVLVEPLDLRELGTAAHAALECIFSVESGDARKLAERVFWNSLPSSAIEDLHAVEALKRVHVFAESEWGRRIRALPAESRLTERPFRFRAEFAGGSTTLVGKFDLVAQIESGRWQVLDFKLARHDPAGAESNARYGWQIAIYADLAQELLATKEKPQGFLIFLLDDNPTIKERSPASATPVSRENIRALLHAFTSATPSAAPLAHSAQLWMAGEGGPVARTRDLCRSHRCPHLDLCFPQ